MLNKDIELPPYKTPPYIPPVPPYIPPYQTPPYIPPVPPYKLPYKPPSEQPKAPTSTPTPFPFPKLTEPPFFGQPWYTKPWYTPPTQPTTNPMEDFYQRALGIGRLIPPWGTYQSQLSQLQYGPNKPVQPPEGNLSDWYIRALLGGQFMNYGATKPPTAPTSVWYPGRRPGGGGGFGGGGGYVLPDWMTGLFALNANVR